MTIHFVSIPSTKTILHALIANQSSGIPWHNIKFQKSVCFYSRGMWAMAEGVVAILNNRGKKNGQVWLPDYFCNNALIQLRQNEISPHF